MRKGERPGVETRPRGSSSRWGGWMYQHRPGGHCRENCWYSKGYHPSHPLVLVQPPPSRRCSFVFRPSLPPLCVIYAKRSSAGRWWKGTWLIYARVKRACPRGLKYMYKQNLGDTSDVIKDGINFYLPLPQVNLFLSFLFFFFPCILIIFSLFERCMRRMWIENGGWILKL